VVKTERENKLLCTGGVEGERETEFGAGVVVYALVCCIVASWLGDAI
jgi:hypothetical protein